MPDDDWSGALRAGLKDEDEGDAAVPTKAADKTDKKERAEARPPSFEMVEIGAELPPPDVKPRGGGEKRPEVVANLEAIKESPGTWFVVATYTTRGGAKTVVKAIVDGKQATPAGFYHIDYRGKRDEDGKLTMSEVIARFIGATEEEAEAFEQEHGEYVSAYNPPEDVEEAEAV